LARKQPAVAAQKKKSVEPDPVRNEALRIARDLVEFHRQTKTASLTPEQPLPQ